MIQYQIDPVRIRRTTVRCAALIAGIALLGSCADLLGGSDGGGGGGGTAPRTISDSVPVIPASLQVVGGINPTSVDEAEDGVIIVYDLIPGYVQLADEVRTFAVDLVDGIVTDLEQLDAIPTGEVFPIDTADPSQGYFEIVTPGADGYERQVTVYDNQDRTGATFRLDFTVNDQLQAEGRVRFTESAPLAGTGTSAGFAVDTITATDSIEITFDGISATQTLSIRYERPLDALIAAASGLDYSTDQTTLDAMELGQAETLAIDVTFDGSQYTVAGYSYHPGLETLYDLGIEPWLAMFDDPEGEAGSDADDAPNRSSYLFRAIVPVDGGSETGASMALAFPEDDATTVQAAFTDEALGGFVSAFYTEALNDEIVATTDLAERNFIVAYVLDLLPEYTPGEQLTQAELEAFGAWITAIDTLLFEDEDTATGANGVYDALGTRLNPNASAVAKDDIAVLAAFAADDQAVTFPTPTGPFFDAANYAALKAYVRGPTADPSDTALTDLADLTLAELNSVLDDTALSDGAKTGLLAIVRLPAILDAIDDTNYTITDAQLQTFLAANPDDPDAQALLAIYETAGRIINPAFYLATTGFQGTYNADADVFYPLEGSALGDGVAVPAGLAPLAALDLTAVSAPAPADARGFFAVWVVAP